MNLLEREVYKCIINWQNEHLKIEIENYKNKVNISQIKSLEELQNDDDFDDKENINMNK